MIIWPKPIPGKPEAATQLRMMMETNGNHAIIKDANLGGSHMVVHTNQLSPQLFLPLYQSVGWDAPGVAQIQQALEGAGMIELTHILRNFLDADGKIYRLAAKQPTREDFAL